MSETIELPVIDKSNWPDGPWKSEPDRIQWQHAGYACLITRHSRMGQLCGYVGVDRAHPFYGKPYQDVADLSVHGGVSYSNKCSGWICHVPDPGMPEDVWWFGFDCAHFMDLVPGMFRSDLPALPPNIAAIEARHLPEERYRDIEYVKAETEQLAEQLRALSSNHGKQSN